jgi:hypothetical protein
MHAKMVYRPSGKLWTYFIITIWYILHLKIVIHNPLPNFGIYFIAKMRYILHGKEKWYIIHGKMRYILHLKKVVYTALQNKEYTYAKKRYTPSQIFII